VNFSPKISKISQIYFFLIKKFQNFPNLFVEIEFFWENKTLPSHNSQRVTIIQKNYLTKFGGIQKYESKKS
jgi:hypothetical protein